MKLELSEITDPRLSRGLAYWDRVRGGRVMPSRRDIRPREILALLPHVFLADVLTEPLRFRMRLAGTEVVNRFGEELTGRMLEEIDLGDRAMPILASYVATVAERAPQLTMEEYLRRDGRLMHYRRLLCPLSTDERRVDMLFGVMATTPLANDTA
ncbi:MAG: PAS domain-containing protein [Sneathiellaceae bacterium]